MESTPRVVITGVGLASPNGASLSEFRRNLLNGVGGVRPYHIRYIGDTFAGICEFDPLQYQKRRDLRIGTRAGSIGIYCANQALEHAHVALDRAIRSRIGVFIGITEHGNVETENEVHDLGEYGNDVRFWSHYHNPRTVANNPAGEVTINLGITGPHYTVGAACAAGNMGVVQGYQQLVMGDVDMALAGGVSESIHTFGIFASFRSQGALATHTDADKASRPFDRDRNGIVISEGGAVFVLERLEDARRRGAVILGEIAGYCQNSDATDMVLPNPERQAECMRCALERAGLAPGDVDLVSTHATGTRAGDAQECAAIREVFGDNGGRTWFNNTKSFIGHAMGAAGALELAGNLPSFEDGLAHPTVNLGNLDPECALPGLVVNTPERMERSEVLLNNSFGMLGINCVLIVRKYIP